MATEIQLSFDLNKLLEQPTVPIMRPSRFAELIGVSPSTITNLMDSNQIPVTEMTGSGEGKRPTRYINLVKLFRQCDSEHFVNSVNTALHSKERGVVQ
ncbi:MAG: hypothetical protein JXR18_14145 [Neptuniibacter sp.]